MRQDWEIFRAVAPGLPAEKVHAAELDLRFGLRCAEIEAELMARARRLSASENFQDWGPALHHRDQQTWVGLPVQSLMTPYAELLRMLEVLAPEPGWTLTDLGAGYGRLGAVAAARFPQVCCLGFEWVRERVAEGNRVFGERVGPAYSLVQADVSSEGFALPQAQAHFMYDIGSQRTIRRVLRKIQEQARGAPLLVVGRGRATRHLIERENPWLSGIVAPAHHDTFTIYRSG